MLKVRKLYRPFHMKKTYEDINEEGILIGIYAFREGTFEEVISKTINQAVLDHMNLSIDSTIMQMLALNEYLSKLFVTNFNRLVYNYMICYMESRNVDYIDETIEEKISSLAEKVDMKTDVGQLATCVDQLCEKNP